jgi:hypothetical protein
MVRPIPGSWEVLVMVDGYRQAVDLLERELHEVDGVLATLSDEDWGRPTRLVPEGDGVPRGGWATSSGTSTSPSG